MKTFAASLLALGLIATTASAQWCPPGTGYGKQRPTIGRSTIPVPPAVTEPAPQPTPEPEPVPQK